MFLSVTLGALLYALIQFAWYSPLMFGRQWLSLKRSTPDEAVAGLKAPTVVPESLLHLVAPAFLMSVALHTLAVVLSRFGQLAFFYGVAGMFALTAGPKYLRFRQTDVSLRTLWPIQDGVLALALAVLALFIASGQGKVY